MSSRTKSSSRINHLSLASRPSRRTRLTTFAFLLIALTLTSFTQIASSSTEFMTVTRPPSPSKSAKAEVKVQKLLSAIKAFSDANSKAIRFTKYGEVEGFDLVRLDVKTASDARAPKVLITGGIHGNETLAALVSFEFLKRFMTKPELHQAFNLVIIPATNPKALALGSRRYAEGIDLNRLFVDEDRTPEIVALKETLKDQSFSMLLDLHGGPTRQHFFSIRAAADNGLAERALQALPQDLVLESNDGRYPGRTGLPSHPDRYLMPAKGVAESKLVGTFKAYGFDHLKIPYAYTVEYPMRNEIEVSLNYYADLIEAFLRSYNSKVLQNN